MNTNLAVPRFEIPKTSVRPRLGILTYPVALVAVFATMLALWIIPWIAFVPIAVLFGWTQVGCLCGMSHVMALTPLWFSGKRQLWVKCVAAYTTAGLFSSVAVGAVLGGLGRLGASSMPPLWKAGFVAILAALLAGRELGWLRFKIPQVYRQTERRWGNQFNFCTAAGMWGFHIGLGFATVITYGGFWILVVAIVLLSSSFYGLVIMGAYWLGRTLSLWVAPLSEYRKLETPLTPADKVLLRRAQALGLLSSAGVSFLVFINS